MESTDRELMDRYRRGGAEALGELVERHRRSLYGFIIGMSRGRDDPDDVFQEVWCRVIRKAGMYRDKNFRGWLMRIAHNVIIDRSRKRKPDVSLDAERGNGPTLLESLSDDRPGPHVGIEREDIRTDIARAVERLPDEQREVFLMRAVSGMPFKEIARVQRVSINTALARMQYALAKLRAGLGAAYASQALSG